MMILLVHIQLIKILLINCLFFYTFHGPNSISGSLTLIHVLLNTVYQQKFRLVLVNKTKLDFFCKERHETRVPLLQSGAVLSRNIWMLFITILTTAFGPVTFDKQLHKLRFLNALNDLKLTEFPLGDK